MNVYHCLMLEFLFFIVYAFVYALVMPRVALGHQQAILQGRSEMPPQMWAAMGDD